MRIRSVKPEYWQHRMHKRLSVSASLLGAALMDYADDDGRFEADGDRIRGMLLPNVRLERSIGELLAELAALDWLVLYAVTLEGVEVVLGQICSFALHQSIEGKSTSLLPPPPPPWGQVLVWVRKGQRRVQCLKWVRIEGGTTGPEQAIDDQSPINRRTVVSGITDQSSVDRFGMRPGEEWKEGRGEEGKRESRAPDGVGDLDSGGDVARGTFSEGDGPRGGTVPAPASSGDGFRDAGGRMVDRDPGAAEPTVEEVVGFGASLSAPEGYARGFHGDWTADHRWVVNGRLRDWKHHFRKWWAADAREWAAGNHRWQRGLGVKNGVEKKNRAGLSVFRQMEVLREQIDRHPANPKSDDYEPRCKAAQKRQLEWLEERLQALERGESVVTDPLTEAIDGRGEREKASVGG